MEVANEGLKYIAQAKSLVSTYLVSEHPNESYLVDAIYLLENAIEALAK